MEPLERFQSGFGASLGPFFSKTCEFPYVFFPEFCMFFFFFLGGGVLYFFWGEFLKRFWGLFGSMSMFF